MNRSSFLRRSLAAVAAVAFPRILALPEFAAPVAVPAGTATVGTWTGGPAGIAYLWQRRRADGEWETIDSAPGGYVLQREDEGCWIRASASAPNY